MGRHYGTAGRNGGRRKHLLISYNISEHDLSATLHRRDGTACVTCISYERNVAGCTRELKNKTMTIIVCPRIKTLSDPPVTKVIIARLITSFSGSILTVWRAYANVLIIFFYFVWRNLVVYFVLYRLNLNVLTFFYHLVFCQ